MKVALFVICLLLSVSARTQNIRYVKAIDAGQANGSSWANATDNIQYAINSLSATGGQVWVAQGIYKPTANTTDRTTSFSIASGVEVFGGFPNTGNPTSLTARNPGSYTTVLSGDINYDGTLTGNSYHVVQFRNANSTTRLDGFIITGGNANGSDPYERGAGIYNNGNGTGNVSNPTLVNLSFTNNTATYGGGIYNTGDSQGNASPTIINVSFVNNTASLRGGAVYCNGNTGRSSPRLVNVSLAGNSAITAGGGFYIDGTNGSGSSLTLTNGVVWGNGEGNSFYTTNASLSVGYSLLESSITGFTNGGNNKTIGISPFLSATDLRLQTYSGGIDAGSNAAYTALNGPATDLSGQTRTQNGTIDMGAYESSQSPTLLVTAVASSSVACAGSIISLSAGVQGGTPPYSYTWSTPGGATLSATSTPVVSATLNTIISAKTFTLSVGAAGGLVGSTTISVQVAPTQLYVNRTNGIDEGPGTKWGTAFKDLQSALTTNNGCLTEVWVAAGTYRPTSNTVNRTASFIITPGLQVYGGFPTTGSPTFTDRDPSHYSTVLSGDINSDKQPTGNSHHVVQFRNANSSTRLDGFVITGGNADGVDPDERGAGIYNNGNGNASNPTLVNLRLTDNTATYGAGIYNTGDSQGNASPTIINTSFVNNTASLGGAVYNNGNSGRSSPTLTNVSFAGNSAVTAGGALYIDGTNGSGSSLTLTNGVVWGNGEGNSFYTTNASLSVGYSLLESSITGFTNGGNNKTTGISPFVDDTDLHLLSYSGGIDAGNNAAYTALNGPATDLGGQTRTQNGTIDMGAYESSQLPTLLLTAAASALSVCTGSIISLSVVVQGGNPPYSYTWATPGGATLSATSTPVVSATVTTAGTQTFTLSVGAAGGLVGSTTVSVQAIAPPSRLFVRASATSGANTGLDWDNAFTNLQSALTYSCSQALSEIWVAQGTYRPTAGTTDRTASFSIASGLQVYGGFPATGNPTSLAVRNPASYTTVLSGDIDGDGLLNRNSYHVVRFKNAGSGTRLDGFVITGGNANGNASTLDDRGAGIYNDGSQAGNSSQPTLASLTLVGNSAANIGGGMYNNGFPNGNSSPTITNSSFSSNSAVYGGAMYNDAAPGGISSPILTSVSFASNTATYDGGAMYNDGTSGNSSPTLINVSFTGNLAQSGGAMLNSGASSGVSNPTLTNTSFTSNSATVSGGGMYNYGYQGTSRPVLTNVTFASNTATRGGAMYNDGRSGNGSPVISNVRFTSNVAALHGGAMYNNGSSGISSPTLTNTLFTNNSASNLGGVMFNLGSQAGNSSPVLTNVSIAGNSATAGGVMCNNSENGGLCNPRLTNCILYNSGGVNSLTVSGVSSVTSVTVAIAYSLLEPGMTGYTSGPGNLTATSSPFASTTSLQVAAGSPAIDAGDPATTTALVGLTDLAGNPRFVNGRIEMGAFEYQGNAVTDVYSLQAGSWDAPLVWSVGRLPLPGEQVRLLHRVSLPAGYQALGGRLTYGPNGQLVVATGATLKLTP